MSRRISGRRSVTCVDRKIVCRRTGTCAWFRVLNGKVRLPGGKSISQRALMLGAVALGEWAISGLLEAADVIHTAQAMQALGAQVAHGSDGIWRVQGVGVAGLAQPDGDLDF